jgi:hypothetical protein
LPAACARSHAQADDERAQAQLLRMVRDHPAITSIIAINDANALHATVSRSSRLGSGCRTTSA